MTSPYANKTTDELMDMFRGWFDEAGYKDTGGKPSPWAPGDREAFARAGLAIFGPRVSRLDGGK